MDRPEEQETYKSKLFNFKGMFDLPGRHAKSLSVESATILDPTDEAPSRSQGSDNQIGNALDRRLRSQKIREEQAIKETREKLLQEMEQMKERFAKLLLGEDMSGGGKGVSSALALSNEQSNVKHDF